MPPDAFPGCRSDIVAVYHQFIDTYRAVANFHHSVQMSLVFAAGSMEEVHARFPQHYKRSHAHMQAIRKCICAVMVFFRIQWLYLKHIGEMCLV